MDAKAFEQLQSLDVVAADDDGITRISVDSIPYFLCRIGKPSIIYLLYQSEPWEFYTYVVDGYGKAVRFSGFAWGYGGEGPRGLNKLIDSLKWVTPQSADMPPPHTPGVWAVGKTGKVTVELI